MAIMKTLVTLIYLGIGASAMAQQPETSAYRQLSKSINDDGKTLSIQLSGERLNGQKIQYDRKFNVADLSAEQRNALKSRVLDSLGVNMPDPPKPPRPPKPLPAGTETVTFACETCTGKSRLEVYGNGFTSTRQFDAKKDEKPAFPLTLTLNPGDYRLMYWQNKVLQIQSTFTVKAGEANVVKVK